MKLLPLALINEYPCGFSFLVRTNCAVENESDESEYVKEKNTDQPPKYHTIGAVVALQL